MIKPLLLFTTLTVFLCSLSGLSYSDEFNLIKNTSSFGSSQKNLDVEKYDTKKTLKNDNIFKASYTIMDSKIQKIADNENLEILPSINNNRKPTIIVIQKNPEKLLKELQSLKDLIKYFPDILDPVNATTLAIAVNQFERGFNYEVIIDPNLYKREYLEEYESLLPIKPYVPNTTKITDFGFQDLEAITSPVFENNELSFFTKSISLGVAYKATALIKEGEIKNIAYEPVAMKNHSYYDNYKKRMVKSSADTNIAPNNSNNMMIDKTISKEVELDEEGNAIPYLLIDGKKTDNIEALYAEIPVLLDPYWVKARAQFINHFHHGFDYEVIIAPEAFEDFVVTRLNLNTHESKNLSKKIYTSKSGTIYPLPDFSSIHEPKDIDDNLIFYIYEINPFFVHRVEARNNGYIINMVPVFNEENELESIVRDSIPLIMYQSENEDVLDIAKGMIDSFGYIEIAEYSEGHKENVDLIVEKLNALGHIFVKARTKKIPHDSNFDRVAIPEKALYRHEPEFLDALQGHAFSVYNVHLSYDKSQFED